MNIKCICTLLSVLLLMSNSYAQTIHNFMRSPKGVLKFQFESNRSGSDKIDVNFYNSDFCPYYVNMIQINVVSAVTTGVSTVLTIDTKHPLYKDKNKRSYITYKGKFLDDFNPKFVYAIPLKNGTIVQCERDNNEKQNVIRFSADYRDTVYASRKGIVCHSDYPNGVLVYHSDGTFAAYLNTVENFIEPGTKVNPGDPIGLCGFGGVSLSVFFLDENVFENGFAQTYAYKHFSPYFRTDRGDIKLEMGQSYKTIHDDSIITQEMSKSESKRYYRNKDK